MNARCIDAGLGKPEGLLLGVIGGDTPAAEFSPGAIQRLLEAGIYTPEQAASVIRTDLEKWAEVVRKTGIRAN